MSDITLSAGVRQNLLSLQNTADMMATTQSRLATGKKVNSALDNPTNFFTSQSLNNRASDLSSLLDSMSNGMKTLEAADNGLTSMTKTLESMQSTLRQARQDKSFEKTSYSVDLGDTPAGTEQLSLSGGALAAGVDIDLTTAGTGTAGSATAAYTADATAFTASTAAEATFTRTGDMAFDDAGDKLEFTIDVDGSGSPTTITIDAQTLTDASLGTTIIDSGADLAAAITQGLADAGVTGVTVSASGDDVTFTTDSTGADAQLDISAVTATNNGGSDTLADATGFSLTTANGADGDAVTFDIDVDGTSTSVTIDAQTLADASVGTTIDDITELTSVLDQALTDAGVTGVSVANDGTNVTFTSDSQGEDSSVTLSNFDTDADSGNNTNSLYGLASATSTAGTGEGALVAKTVDALVAEINANSDLEGKVRASNDNGSLRIENQSTNDLTVTGVTASTGTVDGSTGTDTIDGNKVRSDLATQFNDLRDQLDKLSDDSSFNGINLLQGDLLTMTFNETSTSTLDIQSEDGETINSSYLGLSTIDADALDADTDIDSLISTVKSALGTIRSQASTFGSNLSMVENREDFTKNMINTLETGADDLVLADTNEEAANMLALQTRQQLSSTALSLASQADQAVLRLF
ncbi:flagellin N-terminal helical domain-containing protein [Rhodobium gokarnense]|uniref:Flagellin n=1 Tax=Rhodobium gokarnense TaxID=364296 RepID=A0ABT3HDB5_9HYPH|nr:flagellin [Rhodobium gokarnense]MCW2308314.1 flagellin-like hook-associated protein FlgL [Rhodobium gokarnense]